MPEMRPSEAAGAPDSEAPELGAGELRASEPSVSEPSVSEPSDLELSAASGSGSSGPFGPAAIEVRALSCAYGEREALRTIELAVSRGAFLGLVGPNASGKTTLLKAICRSLHPRSGAVLVDGQDVSAIRRRELARRVAIVPQETFASFAFTVREVVMMGRTPHLGRFDLEGTKDLEVVERAMQLTALEGLADRPITELSGGERQRAIIAQALAQEPRVLLLDEPTLHLDLDHQLEIMEVLKRLNAGGMTIIAALHDLDLAAYYCDTMALIGSGRLVAAGPPEDVFTESNLRSVFRAPILVRRHPLTGRLHLSPIPGAAGTRTYAASPRAPQNALKVHVICGGGSGAALMRELAAQGFFVSAGVVNALDTDHEVAELLGLVVISEAPFSPIGEEAHDENLRRVQSSDVVVVAGTPFGPANIRNLEAAAMALESGKALFIVGTPSIDGRDFTGGRASELLSGLERGGAMCVAGEPELLRELLNLTVRSDEAGRLCHG